MPETAEIRGARAPILRTWTEIDPSTAEHTVASHDGSSRFLAYTQWMRVCPPWPRPPGPRLCFAFLCPPGDFHPSGLPWGSDGKNPPAVQDIRFQSLVWDYPLEEGMQPTPVFLPGESPWTEESGGQQSTGHKESDMTEWLSADTHTGTYSQYLVITFNGK